MNFDIFANMTVLVAPNVFSIVLFLGVQQHRSDSRGPLQQALEDLLPKSAQTGHQRHTNSRADCHSAEQRRSSLDDTCICQLSLFVAVDFLLILHVGISSTWNTLCTVNSHGFWCCLLHVNENKPIQVLNTNCCQEKAYKPHDLCISI